MRIVLDLQACQASNRERGIGRYALALARHMAQLAQSGGRAHDVHIVLSNRFPDSVAGLRAAFADLLAPGKISVFDLPAGLAGAGGANNWRMRAAERLREHYLASLQPDVVHVASLFEGWGDDAVTSIGQGASGPALTAVTLFDLIPLVRDRDYLAEPRMRRWYFRKLQSLKSANLLLAISNHTRAEAIATLHLPAERIVDISSAVDPMFAPRTLDVESRAALRRRHGLHRPFLMYTGGIDARKNIDGLICAFGRLPEAQRTTHQLAVVCRVGDGERKRLTALARRQGLGRSTLVMTGYVPDADLVGLYNLAEGFVFPSLHEGFGLPALEAMACGLPVIGSNTSSIPEVIGCKEALFDPTDLDAMADRIGALLGDAAFRTRLKTHGAEQARKFSWKASAERALDALEQLHARRRPGTPTLQSGAARPRLAFVSPLPPERSGIADYSAALVAALVADYDIDVIVQSEVDDPWILANCRVRSIAWFERHGAGFDRVLYHFGNSAFHARMFDLLARFPGVVVLHDFYLSGIINYLEHTGHTPHALARALYDSHGYAALVAGQGEGRQSALWSHPCNRQVLADAQGVIVHSRYAQELARHWYGPRAAHDWVVMPFPRAPGKADRAAARARLGLSHELFLTCSFGLLGGSKLNDRLLSAWLASPMARDPRCHLVFVGQNDPGRFGAAMGDAIAASGCAARITITGFASRPVYLDYLAATDCAVQLRANSRGETSAAIMDCLAFGVPTIANANGSAAELPDTVLRLLPDLFTQEQLQEALAHFHRNRAAMRDYSERARSFLVSQHDPHRVGRKYRDAIEHFSSAALARRQLLRGLARLDSEPAPQTADWAALAACIALNQAPPPGPRQLLVDISELVQRDARSGIQRVVRNVLACLLERAPQGFRVEPVYERGGLYRYARRFACAMLGCDAAAFEDTPIDATVGDIFLGLDLLPHAVPANRALLQSMRNRGVSLYFVVYDLLPVLQPHFFVKHAALHFGRWLKTVASQSDGLLCISRAVADDLSNWLAHNPAPRDTALNIGYFHLGADIPTPGVPAHGEGVTPHTALLAMQAAPSLLVVGTLEPRKGHAQALAAFELLWAQGSAALLVIVGRQGWQVDKLAERLRTHPENGKRLFWVEDASDQLLLQMYGAASALLAPSEGEGFGLPLIEAAQRGLPILARDLAVFREVAGEHACFFSGAKPQALARAIDDWLTLHAAGSAPPSAAMPWLTWAASTQQLIDVIVQQRWHCAVTAMQQRTPTQ